MPAIRKTIIFLVVLLFPSLAWATISSSVITGDCPAGQVTVLKMSAPANAHAGLPSSSYPVSVCVGGVSGLSNSCSGTFAVVAKLSGPTNAHVRLPTEADYPGSNNVCLSVPAGGTVRAEYRSGDCAGFETTLFSLAKVPTNSHAGDPGAYLNKLCASAAEPPGVILISGSSSSPPAESSSSSPNSAGSLGPANSSLPVRQAGTGELSEVLAPSRSQRPQEPAGQSSSFTSSPILAAVEIPQVRPVEERNILTVGQTAAAIIISPAAVQAAASLEGRRENRGFLAAAAAFFSGIDFPPRDPWDWSLWTAVIFSVLIALRIIWKKAKKT